MVPDLWSPTNLVCRTTRSRQYHESTMVWPNLPPCHRFLYFVLLFSTKTAWQRGSKHHQRFYEGKLRQTMVDSWYCLDQVGAEGGARFRGNRRLGNINGVLFLDGLCCQTCILCTFGHYVYSKTFSFLRISENAWIQFLVKVSSV